MMSDFEFDLKNQIEFEINCRNYRYIFEKLGYPEYVLDFTRGFIQKVIRQIKETDFDCPTSRTYTEKDFESDIPFIEEYEIGINLSLANDNFSSYGGLRDAQSKIYLRDGNLMIKPVIEISIIAEDRVSLRNETFSTIGHEMTHAYSEYMTLKSKRDKLFPLLSAIGEDGTSIALAFISVGGRTEKKYYRNNNFLRHPSNSFDETFAMIAYTISEPERRAQMSELRHELENKSSMIRDSKSAVDALINSKVYENTYKALNDVIDEFLNLITDKDYKIIFNVAIKSFNRVFEKNYKNIGDIVRFLINIREEYNRFFRNRSGKVIQDILDNNISMEGSYIKPRKLDIKAVFDEILELEKR